MADNPIRLGLVGLGAHMVDNLLHRLMTLPVEIAAVCDILPERISFVERKYRTGAAYTDYKRMLERESLDAVICSATPQIHYEVAKSSMLADLPVFVEKTPCRTVEQAEELAALQQSTGRYAMVGFNRRFATAYLMAKEVAQRAKFGGIHMYQAKYHAGAYGSKHAFIFNHIVNHMDLARFLLGELAVTHAEAFELDDRRFGYNITLMAESGAIGNIQSASVQDMTFPVERVELIGSGQNVIVDNLKSIVHNRPGQWNGGGMRAAFREQGDAQSWNVNNGLHTSFTYLGYDLELLEFVQSAAKRREPAVHMGDTVKTIRLMEQVRRLLQ
ncbi:Gfo/Idh/MocA family protein [Paenibacillus sp. TAB 01]|uniref:Gfo/Idh/MocA family protein n=1 Tax=Paenibacillus sp. TAB 01 TaxID=3368988 RepID=UPI0037514250